MLSTTIDLLPAQEIFTDAKPGIRYYLLLKTLPTLPSTVVNRPYIDEMDRVLSGLYDTQAKAIKLESQGKEQLAMRLYWQLVTAQFDDPHPFLRLVEYYKSQNDQRKIAIVCKTYLQMTVTLNDLGYEQPYRSSLADVFRDLLKESSLAKSDS